MAASVFDSPLYAQLFPTGEAGRLFSDSAVLRAMLLVEGALAKAQGAAGTIPEMSAAAIHRASLEVEIDPGALAQSTGQNGVCVPGLVAAFRSAMNAPEHAQFIHWGATSQDVIDTGLMLRLRQVIALAETDVRDLLQALAHLAETHRDTPMSARTYGQIATPTTFGALLAQWGNPLLDALDALPALRDGSLWVSLSGAAGTASVLGDSAPALRAALAAELGLRDPGRSWHTDRGPILRIANWFAEVSATLGSMAATLAGLSASGIGEIGFGHAGASSTMPQKHNPVVPSALLALSHTVASLRSGLQIAAQHQHQRDGAAWFTEWVVLPQLVLAATSTLQLANRMAKEIVVMPDTMRTALEDGLGLVQAEALSFALAKKMPRPDAQAATKSLCARALSEEVPLVELAMSEYPWLDAGVFRTMNQLGQAPAEAQNFVTRFRAL